MLDWLKGLDDGKTLYATVFESEVQAMDGKYVKEGLECSANNTNLTISISAGSVRYLDTDYSYGGGSVVLDAGEADRDRIDVIVWDYNNGSPKITILKGSRWYNDNGVLKPVTERISPQHIPLAIVKVRAGENKVYATDVYDVRLGLRRDVNVDSLKISGTEVISSDRVLRNIHVKSVSKGLMSVTVTETTLTLKQELVPDEGFYGFAYVEGIRVRAENPTGSEVNLFFIIKVLLDDGNEVELHDEVQVDEGSVFDDGLRWIYDAVPHGKMIRSIRLYAYCSDLPASGYEPSVNIEKVVGVMV